MINNCYSGFYSNISPDKRLDKRMDKIISDLLLSGTATVNKAVADHSSKTAFYRTLLNTRLDHNDILSGSFRKCAENIDVEHVLCLQDTTEFNFNHIADKIGKSDPDIGPTSLKAIAGFFCHPVLVCDPSGQNIYGLASASVYNRNWGHKDKYERKFQNLPIEKKESYRWIENALNARKLISKEVVLTIIGDRESDIYEEFIQVASKNTHLLIRSRVDRRVEGTCGKLYAHLQQQPLAGKSIVDLTANYSREKRTAELEIRYSDVEIKAPNDYKGKQKSFKLYAIEAKEVTPNLPSDQKAILWRLLTTHPIENLEQALECIEWYKHRWLIEEIFRVIKTKGFEIESSQLGNGASLKKLLAFTLEAAIQVMRLKLALDNKSNATAKLMFSDKQLIYLALLLKKVEGNTAKQKNPYNKNSIAWAAWTIARLGKWTGYKSHGPPGYITMKNGFEIFNIQYEVFAIFNDS
jgi:hypothetical protein